MIFSNPGGVDASPGSENDDDVRVVLRMELDREEGLYVAHNHSAFHVFKLADDGIQVNTAHDSLKRFANVFISVEGELQRPPGNP